VRLTVSGKANGAIEAAIALVAIGVSPLMPHGIRARDRRQGLAQGRCQLRRASRESTAPADIIGPPWLAHVASFEAVQAVEGMFDRKVNPAEVGVLPRMHLLPAAGRQRGPHRARRHGRRTQVQSRKVPVHGERKGACRWRKRGIREAHHRREARGNPRCPHHRRRCHGDDRGDSASRSRWRRPTRNSSLRFHAHPTLSEAVHEAAHASQGHAIHI